MSSEEVVRLVEDGEEITQVPLEDMPRAEQSNPLGLTEAQLVENEEWKRLLRQRHPTMPDMLIDTCISYYRIKGEEAIQAEIDAGLFDKKKPAKEKESVSDQ